MSPKERLTGITTVAELQEVMQECMAQIAGKQEECKHLNYECVMYSYRVGAYNPTRMCTLCKRPLPGITDEEFATVLEEFNSEDQSG